MRTVDKDIINIIQETIIGRVILEPGDKIRIIKEIEPWADKILDSIIDERFKGDSRKALEDLVGYITKWDRNVWTSWVKNFSFYESSLKEMITVRVTLDDGTTFTTGINGTIQTARQYYVGNYFNFGIEGDDMKKAVKVELL